MTRFSTSLETEGCEVRGKRHGGRNRKVWYEKKRNERRKRYACVYRLVAAVKL